MKVRAEHGHVTVFDPLTGHRVSFGPVPTRLRAPELLDVKLTDRCSVGCSFCYQDSRPDRDHARLDDVAFIAQQAGQAGVFEVALGGGEVSEFPPFLEVLRLFRQAGVVPNFTTRRPAWVAERWSDLRDLAGGFAVSVATAQEVEEVARLFPQGTRREGQVNLHLVMGTLSRPVTLDLIRRAGHHRLRVTLLGFKAVGRGAGYTARPHDWWVEDLPRYVQHAAVSIDTALAAQHESEMARLLQPGTYHVEEGRFSAYVDAVQMTLAPSSYHGGPVFLFDHAWLSAFASPGFVRSGA
ncbi:radical SAM protein [Deinococcus sp. QL22]|uniref:radical SAM protein n=1 Tax=Deinococcus sp. QL22 TaxID=2939437 RepID=UPI0020180DC5|nr:radical SAM protein [Deinococcus sp. QL22]UQN06551.1 radical SAM protein [Deinococcus sp. QL22]